MGFNTIEHAEYASRLIENLPNRPNSSPGNFGGGGLSAQQLRAAYDAMPKFIIERLNALIEYIVGTSDDSSLANDIAKTLPQKIDTEILNTETIKIRTLSELFSSILDGRLAKRLYIENQQMTLSEFCVRVRADLLQDIEETISGDETYRGKKGDPGVSILRVEKVSTEGLVDTYRIFFSDGTTHDYTLKNGEKGEKGDTGYGVTGISLISTDGLKKTYRIQYGNGGFFDFVVSDGEEGKVADGKKAVEEHNTDSGAHPNILKKIGEIKVPTKVSELENDSKYLTSESDPSVPAWAKQPSKPSYTASEVGADASGSASAVQGNLDAHTARTDNPHKVTAEQVGADSKGAASAVQSKLNEHEARTDNPHGVTASQVKAEPVGAVSTHNIATDAHNDIRLLISGLTERLNALANSDDTTLDQMAEVVAYIKNNRDLISQITTNKVNVSDIVNDLATNVSNKPLSAAQGVALKALIDAITIPTKVSELDNDKGYLTSFTESDPNVPSWAKQPSKPSYNKSEVGLGNVDNVKQYSASNPPPYPVTSVNGQTGAVSVSVPTKTSQLSNDSGFITSAPVSSVNGKTGAVSLGADDVGADALGSASAALREAKAYVDSKLDVALPAGYTQVEYIESTGTQYINTRLSAPRGFRFVGKVRLTSMSESLQTVVGAFEKNSSGGDTLRSFLAFRNSEALVGAYDYAFTRSIFNSGIDYDIDFDNSSDNFSLKVNGTIESVDIDLSNPNRTSNPLYLFAMSSGSGVESFSRHRLSPSKIYIDGALALNAMPCINPNGKAGLYDFVTNTFLGNEGSGEFVRGPVVEGDILPISNGGTGAKTAEDARANLGINSESWTFTLEDGTTVTKVVYVG